MAIIRCKNCGNDVSDKATQCPHCNIMLGYTNEVAKSFKDWGNRVKTLGIIILIIIIITSLFVQNVYIFLGAFVIYGVFVAMSLFLFAIAEVIQKLQNIEDKINK